MDRLSILVLHSLGDPARTANFLTHHVFNLQRVLPHHVYVYHDVALPLPAYVKDARFDAIILDVTFLGARWLEPEQFEQVKRAYTFVADHDAVKIAFPQDEYDCHELLDEWMCDWRVDLVFSVISSNWDVLYPRYHLQGEIALAYCGCIDDSLVAIKPRPFADRVVDIGYRAKKLLPYFGRIGETKWTIGRDVMAACDDLDLVVDIKLGYEHMLDGDAWLQFLKSSKFVLGANSGSSLLDPRGDIQRSVRRWLAEHPDATFEQVEAACFAGQDGLYSFTAISPRIFEAGLLECCQILVRGEYSGILQAGQHYLPVDSDASSFADVLLMMQDRTMVQDTVRECKTALLDTAGLRCQEKARTTIAAIAARSDGNRSGEAERISALAVRYQQDMAPRYRRKWRQLRRRAQLINMIDRYPVAGAAARRTRAVARQLARPFR